jgi:hypothetical protein
MMRERESRNLGEVVLAANTTTMGGLHEICGKWIYKVYSINRPFFEKELIHLV